MSVQGAETLKRKLIIAIYLSYFSHTKTSDNRSLSARGRQIKNCAPGVFAFLFFTEKLDQTREIIRNRATLQELLRIE